jgi:hypothetical protein
VAEENRPGSTEVFQLNAFLLKVIVPKIEESIASDSDFAQRQFMSETPMSPDIVPVELGGKWLAWDEDAIRLVGWGETEQEALAAARAAGVAEPYLEKAPPSDKGFIGCL